MPKNAIKIKETTRGKASCEAEKRYDVLLRGNVVGQLYYNLGGYVGYLPTPRGRGLDAGETSISRWKKAMNRLNKEWGDAGEIAYYEIGIRREPRNSHLAYRNDVRIACKPFPPLSSEGEVRDVVASGGFLNYVFDRAIEQGLAAESERRLVTGVRRVEEADFWKRILVQPY